MENMRTEPKKVIKISRKKLIILVILLTVGFILLNKQNNYRYGNTTMVTPPMAGSMESGKSVDGVSAPSGMPYYPGYQDTSSAKDTREFMKVAYNAEIKTRDVEDVMGDIKNAIRDATGRIDSLSETPKYAYVSFVIPKNNFNNFKAEIEGITHKKLYTENTSSQNLLGQKQSIEEQRQTATLSLAEAQKKQKNLIAQHNQAVSGWQSQIAAVQNQLMAVRASIAATTDPNTLASLRNQEYALIQRESSLKQSLNTEDSTYATNNQIVNKQISSINQEIANIAKQDTAFTDNIETVNGYISVNWISIWDMAVILFPVHPTIVIIALVLLGWYYLSRKNYLPKIEFV